MMGNKITVATRVVSEDVPLGAGMEIEAQGLEEDWIRYVGIYEDKNYGIIPRFRQIRSDND